MLKRNNFNIRYGPSVRGEHDVGLAICVELRDDFLAFMKTQEVDKKEYEELGRRMYKFVGFVHDKGSIPEICQWEGNHLFAIHVPGSATCLWLDERDSVVKRYTSENLDSVEQATPLLGVITNYLFELDYRITSL